MLTRSIELADTEVVEIKEQLKKKLNTTFPNAPDFFSQSSELFLPSEWLPSPLRVSTPQIICCLPTLEITYDKNIMRHPGKKQFASFSKLYFPQLTCLYFFKQLRTLPFEITESLKEHNKIKVGETDDKKTPLEIIAEIINKDPLSDFSCADVLNDRDTFSKAFDELMKNTRDQKELTLLKKVKGAYYLFNDQLFARAPEPSYFFSPLMSALDLYGSRIALALAIVTIIATALSLIYPLVPLFASLAAASAFLTLCIGLPLTFLRIVGITYHAAWFGAAPTFNEVIMLLFFSATILSAGLTTVINSAITMGILGSFAQLTALINHAFMNLYKAVFSTAGQLAVTERNDERKAMQVIINHGLFNVPPNTEEEQIISGVYSKTND